MRALQKDIEDIKETARKELTARGNDQMVKTYAAVREAAARYARANNFDLVLHFEGPADDKEADSPVLAMRNINSSGVVPLYWSSSLDISGAIVESLNAAHKRASK